MQEHSFRITYSNVMASCALVHIHNTNIKVNGLTGHTKQTHTHTHARNGFAIMNKTNPFSSHYALYI